MFIFSTPMAFMCDAVFADFGFMRQSCSFFIKNTAVKLFAGCVAVKNQYRL